MMTYRGHVGHKRDLSAGDQRGDVIAFGVVAHSCADAVSSVG